MDVFVGAEYIIANALIALKKIGIDEIKTSDLEALGINIQKSCVEESIDVVLLLSFNDVSAAVYNFSDYFDYTDDVPEPIIRIKSDAAVTELESRFMGYLPIKLLRIILAATQEFATEKE